jgi:hypothetical protein
MSLTSYRAAPPRAMVWVLGPARARRVGFALRRVFNFVSAICGDRM